MIKKRNALITVWIARIEEIVIKIINKEKLLFLKFLNNSKSF